MEEKKILQIELFNFFKQKLRFIFILTFIFSLSAIIYSLSITNYYSSSAILSESENNMSNPSLSSGIGNLIGFNISQNSPLNKYSLEMKSLDFFSILYNNEEFLKNLVALDAYDRNQEKKVIHIIFKPNISRSSITFLLPGNYLGKIYQQDMTPR